MYTYEKTYRYRSDFSTFDNYKRYKRMEKAAFGSMGMIVLSLITSMIIPVFVLMGLVVLFFCIFFFLYHKEQVYIKKFCFVCKKDFGFHEEVVEKQCGVYFSYVLSARHAGCAEEAKNACEGGTA